MYALCLMIVKRLKSFAINSTVKFYVMDGIHEPRAPVYQRHTCEVDMIQRSQKLTILGIKSVVV